MRIGIFLAAIHIVDSQYIFVEWINVVNKQQINVILKAKVTQSCPTLWHPMDCKVHGTLQARTLEWVAIPFSRGSFPIQGLNPSLLHCRRILYQLRHQGSPRILEWVAYLSLLQWIFPTQELNSGLLHCRRNFLWAELPGKPLSLH